MLIAERVATYSLRVDPKTGNVLGEVANATPVEITDALMAKARQYKLDHPEVSMPEATRRVMAAEPRLVHDYAVAQEQAQADQRTYTEQRQLGRDPSVEAHEQTLRLMEREPELSYSAAVKRVFDQNPTLAQRYAAHTTGIG